ncbi:hypothetical protein RI367_005035 [Sorochytrium milnesiophthora]
MFLSAIPRASPSMPRQFSSLKGTAGSSTPLEALLEGFTVLLNTYMQSAEGVVSHFAPGNKTLQRYFNRFALTAALPLALYVVYCMSTLLFAIITATIAVCVVQAAAMLAGGVVLAFSLGLIAFGVVATYFYHHYEVSKYVHKVMESTVDTFLDVAPFGFSSSASTGSVAGRKRTADEYTADDKRAAFSYTHAAPVHVDDHHFEHDDAEEELEEEIVDEHGNLYLHPGEFPEHAEIVYEDEHGNHHPAAMYHEDDELASSENGDHEVHEHIIDEDDYQQSLPTLGTNEKPVKRTSTTAWRDVMAQETEELEALATERMNTKSVPISQQQQQQQHDASAAAATEPEH